MGLTLDAITKNELVDRVMSCLEQRVGGWVMTPNLDHLRRFVRQPEVRHYFAAPTLLVADGQPLVWASRLQGTPIPERVAGSDLIWTISEAAARDERTIYLVGGAGDSALLAARILRGRFDRLRVVGTYSPPLGFESEPTVLNELIERVAAASPDLVFVGLPFPKADQLIVLLRKRLTDAWFFGLGVSFSFIAGDVRRAPRWMQSAGLEWVWRLVQEPRRLARRYLAEGLPFAVSLFAHAVRVRIGRLVRHQPPANLEIDSRG